MAQGTIKDYDPASKTGSLLMDDRTEVSIDPGSVDDPAIRTLRFGQRVRFTLDDRGDGPIARDLTLVTLV